MARELHATTRDDVRTLVDVPQYCTWSCMAEIVVPNGQFLQHSEIGRTVNSSNTERNRKKALVWIYGGPLRDCVCNRLPAHTQKLRDTYAYQNT